MTVREKKTIYACPSYGKEIKLRVKQDITGDTGKGIVRMLESARRELGANVGDKVEIIGPRVLTAEVGKLEGFLAEENSITMDRLVREKLPVEIGVEVAIRRPLKL